MPEPGGWAAAAAALPAQARLAHELPFWRAVSEHWGWQRVTDAGCGAGFHVRLLGTLGLAVVGFDLDPAALRTAPHGTFVGDVLRPPLRAASSDAVLCLGNTVSLLPSRAAQRAAVINLASILTSRGTLLLQGEDAGALVRGGPCVRTRVLADGSVHVRIFQKWGRRVRMLAGVAPASGEVRLTEASLLPTSAPRLTTVARRLGLEVADFPVPPPPGTTVSWWLALRRIAQSK